MSGNGIVVLGGANKVVDAGAATRFTAAVAVQLSEGGTLAEAGRFVSAAAAGDLRHASR